MLNVNSLIDFMMDNALYVVMFLMSGGMIIGSFIERHRLGETIHVNGAVGLMNRNNALLLDIRAVDAYAKGHVAQAKHVPEAQVISQAADYVKQECIVVMDDDGGFALKTATALRRAGAPRVVVLEGGYAAWLAAGLPIKK